VQERLEKLAGGVRFATPRINFAQGDLRQSNGDLDLAIQGNGFLVLQQDGKTLYTRTGQFSVDDDGFISLQGGKSHLSILNADHQAVAINIDSKRTSTPSATTKITFADNLSAGANAANVSDIAVFDSNGGKHTWKVALAPSQPAAAGSWAITVTDETGATVGTSTLKFIGNLPDPTADQLTITATPTNAAPLSVVLDFSQGVTSFSGGATSTLRAAQVDGNGVGELTAITVDQNGQIQLSYTNGKTDTAGAVAIADFRNPEQLARIGSGLFEAPANGVGQSRLRASGDDGVGKIVARQLESSNVNLSQEFGDLILIQRGFQASSQVVSVANDMIQQLFGIRGQG